MGKKTDTEAAYNGKKEKKKKGKLGKILAIIAGVFVLIVIFLGCGDTDDEYDDNSLANDTSTSDSYDDSDSLMAILDSWLYDSDGDNTVFTEPVFTENPRKTAADVEVDADSFTLMVYICGADLESQAGCATTDLSEMLEANTGDNLKIVVQTGGASEWQNDVISSDTVERYLLNSDGLTKVDDLGMVQMTSSSQISDFIKFSTREFPADRYGFIFWDHGGGTIGGYGVDENFDYEGMSIYDISQGFDKAGTQFDFIGFDCCLMGTIEIGNALADNANYLIASEEVEPGSGWYYTNFLNLIESNPGASMKSIGKQIIGDYNSSEYTGYGAETTLSLIDLKSIPDVVEKLNTYMSGSSVALRNSGFQDIATARSVTRGYGDNQCEQIDIIDYVSRLKNIDGEDQLKEAVENCILYNGTTLSGSNGLAMYFPFLDIESYPLYSNIVNSVGIDSTDYTSFFDDFISIEVGGQSEQSNNHPYAADTAAESYEEIQEASWFDDELVAAYEDYYNNIDASVLEIVEKDDGYVLQLSDDDWEIVTNIELQVSIDDGEGYLILGSDNRFDWDDDGDLIVEFDYNWVHMNDCIVPYYFDRNGNFLNGTEFTLGYIPAYLNGEDDIKIWITWTEESTEIMGYTLDYQTVASKGYYQFKDGDQIDFFFDYYDYDGNYIDQYCLEDNYIIYDSSTPLEVMDTEMADYNVETCFYLKDIYQNEYWTETLVYSFD